MAGDRNHLLGNGQILTAVHPLGRNSRPKNPPYDFYRAKERLQPSLEAVASWGESLPASACPNDEIVAEMVIHPRYVSKSEHPDKLFRTTGLRAIGRRSVRDIKPEAWGIKDPPESATTDKLFVAGKRSDFASWASSLPKWSEQVPGADELAQVESIAPYTAEKKLIDLTATETFMAEVVLHNAGSKTMLGLLESYADNLEIELLTERRKVSGWLTFMPAIIRPDQVENFAKFTFLRVLRGMPRLRAFPGAMLREYHSKVAFPNVSVASDRVRAVIFDGGIPADVAPSLKNWVNVIDPKDIGLPDPNSEMHGLAVTSAFLFGPLKSGKINSRPVCEVDHVRVLDTNTGSDLEYYDVLERITSHLDENPKVYSFGCLSLGPARPIDDDEVTAWTAVLDQRLAYGNLLLAVAAGNDGDKDSTLGLNRIQPPSDGVNMLSVGAATSRGKKWERADYSCVGPGRCPGVFKPDGVAFGGTGKTPFQVVGPGLKCIGLEGTSFAAPFGLRSAAGAAALIEDSVHPLTLRALMVHRAKPKQGVRHSEIGWGRFIEDASDLTTCDDCEALVIYEGDLPLRTNLRARVAMPTIGIKGDVKITATLAIAPEVDPEHVSTYTRGGLAITFRPDADYFELDEKGVLRKEPATADFFNTRRLSGRIPEHVLRKDAHKWEPVIRATRSIKGEELNKPFFDIYYHDRERGEASDEPLHLRYAFIVSVRAKQVPDLYDQVLSAHQNLLIPLKPALNVQLTI